MNTTLSQLTSETLSSGNTTLIARVVSIAIGRRVVLTSAFCWASTFKLQEEHSYFELYQLTEKSKAITASL